MERFITGDTGASKSGFASGVRVLECLANTDRFVVTNLALRWDPWVDGKGVARIGLQRLAEELFPWADTVEWRSRVFFFPDLRTCPEAFSQIRWFFLYRPRLKDGEYVLERWDECLMKCKEGTREVVLFGCPPGLPRCHYLIDEAHEFFGAEDWTSLEKTHRSYVSQNRRTGDEVDIITQVPSNVAAPLRKLAVECYYLVNHSKLNAFLVARQPAVISVRVYKRVDWKRADPVLRAWVVKGARRWREGYDSAAGAGVAGGAAADFGERAKGMPVSLFLVGLLVLLFLLFAGCQRGITGFLRYQAKGATSLVGTVVSSNRVSGAILRSLTPQSQPVTSAGEVDRVVRTNSEDVVWYALGRVGLRNGRIVSGYVDPRLPGQVFVGGKWRELP